MTERAGRQHGRVARWQLLEIGIGRGSIRRRLERRELISVLPGVYAVGHEAGGYESRLMAHVLYGGPMALAVATTAGDLWGFAPTSSPRIEIRTERRTRSRQGLSIHGGSPLPPDDRDEVRDIPVTSAARTLLDLAATVDRARLKRAVDEAERMRAFDLRQVEDVLRRNVGCRGAARLRALLADAVDPIDTREGLERRFFEFLDEFGFTRPVSNTLVEGYLVDAVWFEQKIVVELDSWEFHRGRESFESDRERDLDLHLAGYRPIRITSRALDRPAKLAARLALLLTTRSG